MKEFAGGESSKRSLLKIGLIGAGYLGSRHLKHLLALEGVQVSGIWDTDPAVREQHKQGVGVPVAAGLEDLLACSDAVDLVTPTSSHCEIGLQAVAARKPLFVEKPLCATRGEGARLLEAAARAGVPIQVGHIERFNRAFRSLAGTAVRPRFIEAHRLAPWNPRGVDVAVVYDLMIHDLDLVLALAGEEPEALHASGVGVVTDSVDIATARLEFPSGLVANLTASRISLKRMRKLRLFGEREYIALDLDKGTCEYVGGSLPGQALPPGAELLGKIGDGGRAVTLHRRYLEAPEGDALRLELASFRDAVAGGTTPPVTGADGLKALALAERIVEAIGGRESG